MTIINIKILFAGVLVALVCALQANGAPFLSSLFSL